MYSRFEPSYTERPNETNVTYLLISNNTLDDHSRSMISGLAHLSADESIIRRINEMYRTTELVIVVYMTGDITIGYAHMLSQVKAREQLPPEYAALDFPPTWRNLFKIKWIRISAFPVEILQDVKVDGGRSLLYRQPVMVLTLPDAAIALCNMMDDAVQAKRFSMGTCPRSITKYASYDEYASAMRDTIDGGTGRSGRVGVNTHTSREVQELIASFRATKDVKVWRPLDVQNYMVYLAKENDGFALLSHLMDTFSDSIPDLQTILTEVSPHFGALLRDGVGHKFCVRFIEVARPHRPLLKGIMDCLKGQVVEASMHSHGCKVLQAAMEAFPAPGLEAIFRELSTSMQMVLHDPNGSHVIQKLVSLYPTSRSGITKVVCGDFTHNVQHVHGSYVIKALLDALSPDSAELKLILSEVALHISSLVIDTSANYIIQTVLEKQVGGREFLASLLQEILKGTTFQTMCTDKCGSNVAEALLKKLYPQQVDEVIDCCVKEKETFSLPLPKAEEEGMVLENEEESPLLGLSPIIPTIPVLAVAEKEEVAKRRKTYKGSRTILGELVDDAFGNYVVQTLFEVCTSLQFKRIQDHFARHPEDLRGRHGKHLEKAMREREKMT